MNLCNEETTVGEFEVRYPVWCEWLQCSLRVLRKVYQESCQDKLEAYPILKEKVTAPTQSTQSSKPIW